MRAQHVILVVLLAASFTTLSATAGHADAVQREAYEMGPDYVFEAQTPDCADAHVVCFALAGDEAAVTISIVDFATEPGAPPVAGNVFMTGPSGFTTGWLCGEGTIEIVAPPTHLRIELALAGVGECTWSDSEHPLAHALSAPPTRGEVIVKTTVGPTDAAPISPGCSDLAGVAYACTFAGADPHMTGAIADVYLADGTSVGAGAFRVEGFLGPAVIADVHGTTAEGGWHAGAGASDYNFDNVPDSTCACVGAWRWDTGYYASAGVGTFDMTGDGPSADDTFGYAGTTLVGRGVGVVYGWNAYGEPSVQLILP